MGPNVLTYEAGRLREYFRFLNLSFRSRVSQTLQNQAMTGLLYYGLLGPAIFLLVCGNKNGNGFYLKDSVRLI